jgi:hypothetical protein
MLSYWYEYIILTIVVERRGAGTSKSFGEVWVAREIALAVKGLSSVNSRASFPLAVLEKVIVCLSAVGTKCVHQIRESGQV